MIRRDGIDIRLTEEERALRDRLRDQCSVWIDRHLMTLFVALSQAEREHAGCADLKAPEVHIGMRADLLRFEPSLSITGAIIISLEDLQT